MRKYRLLHYTLLFGAFGCLVHASALADPIGHECEGSTLLVAAPPPDASRETLPVVAKIEPTRIDPEPGDSQNESRSDPGERTRIVSYLILRGLQGAGPFLGAR